ncbi:hypothetical protein C0993_009277 [Termitomyces sp. T159_Od127]|nr:hypothetical protein C0993_009277 [Termitomyces sp. T159_Od127]
MQPGSLLGRHAEKFILAGPILEGLVGGLSSFNGVVHAGLVLPKSAILEVDHAFALSISLLLAVLFYVVLICPESREPTLPEDESYYGETPVFVQDPVAVVRGYTVRFIKALIIPITMFAPRAVPGRAGRSYNLVLVGMALFLYLVSIVREYSLLSGFNLTMCRREYTPPSTCTRNTCTLGRPQSWATTCPFCGSPGPLIFWCSSPVRVPPLLRATSLTGDAVVISYFKPKATGTSADAAHIAAELQFDKRLAQASLAVDGLADALVALTPASSQTLFVGLSCLSSFTSGGNPTLHSLGAVCLHACGYSSEVGALFGGMAVLSAIAHIINPYIYALTYGSTVAYLPKTIFVLATALLFSAVLLLTGVSSRREDVVIRDRTSEDESGGCRSAL